MTNLNLSNLSHPSTMAKIKDAALLAVRMAGSNGFGRVVVKNRKGADFLLVSTHRGRPFRVQAADHSDVTEIVKAALQRWHEDRPTGGIRIKNLRLSFPLLYPPSFIPSSEVKFP